MTSDGMADSSATNNDEFEEDSRHDHRFIPFVCPTCKWELTTPIMHGYVKLDFGPHTQWRTTYTPCPTCSDQARARRMVKEIDRLLGQSNIPFRYQEWSFANMPADIDGRAKEKAVLFVNQRAEKRALYLFGALGHGKTSIAVSIIQAAMRREESAVFIRSLDLMNRLKEAIRRGTHDGDDLLHAVKKVKWLALDDLATEAPTRYVIQELKGIIEARMDAGLYTIFTSNLSLGDLVNYWRPDDVEEEVFYPGQRVIDRIAEYSEAVFVRGRNQRERK